MAVRSVILTQSRNEISQPDSTNSDYTDTEINNLIDESIRFIATLVDWPREFKEITPIDGTADYDVTATSLTTNTIKIRTAYFGDSSINGDLGPIEVTTEEKLRAYDPNWLDRTTGSKGRPRFLIQKTKTSITIHPRPNSTEAANGKKIVLNRVYVPAPLSGDSSTPDLPEPYHDLIKFYVAYICYSGKLKNPALATKKLGNMTDQVKILQPIVDKETEEGADSFGFLSSEGLNENIDTGIIP